MYHQPSPHGHEHGPSPHPQGPPGHRHLPPQPQKKPKTGLIIGLSLGGVGAVGLVAALLVAVFVFDVGRDSGPVAGLGESFEIDERLVTVLDVETGIEQIGDEHTMHEPTNEYVGVDLHIEYIGDDDELRWSRSNTALYSDPDTELAGMDLDATLKANPQDQLEPPFRLTPGQEGTMRIIYDVSNSARVNYLEYGVTTYGVDSVLIDLNGPVHG